MSANANAKPWRPRCLEDIDEIARASRGCRPPTVSDYAARIGVSGDELVPWVAKITMALRARPDALDCLRHLRDLRAAGTKPPCVQPSDILRRRNALQRAKALAAVLPIWPNQPPPEPNPHLERAKGRRDSRHSVYGDDGDED
jgi:hypothetical protein